MIDIELFGPPFVLDPGVRDALVVAQDALADAAATALFESASFSEHFFSRRKAQQLATQITADICAALHSDESRTQHLEQTGRALAQTGLLREAVARLCVAWTDAALARLRDIAPDEQLALWVTGAAATMARVAAAIQAGFEEGRRLRILAENIGLCRNTNRVDVVT